MLTAAEVDAVRLSLSIALRSVLFSLPLAIAVASALTGAGILWLAGAGTAALLRLGQENGFEVDTTTNASYFHEDSLGRYAAVVFLNTTGDVLNQYQEADFERYMQAGGGFVGIHSAAETEYDWAWYGKLLGAYFEKSKGIKKAAIKISDSNHPSTKELPYNWILDDEYHSLTCKLADNIKILAEVKPLAEEDEKLFKVI